VNWTAQAQDQFQGLKISENEFLCTISHIVSNFETQKNEEKQSTGHHLCISHSELQHSYTQSLPSN
jgi:hypothetical protein